MAAADPPRWGLVRYDRFRDFPNFGRVRGPVSNSAGQSCWCIAQSRGVRRVRLVPHVLRSALPLPGRLGGVDFGCHRTGMPDRPSTGSRRVSVHPSVIELVGSLPRGEVRTCRQVADAVGRPAAARAVASALATNPVSLLWCPAHRVVRSDGLLSRELRHPAAVGQGRGCSSRQRRLTVLGCAGGSQFVMADSPLTVARMDLNNPFNASVCLTTDGGVHIADLPSLWRLRTWWVAEWFAPQVSDLVELWESGARRYAEEGASVLLAHETELPRSSAWKGTNSCVWYLLVGSPRKAPPSGDMFGEWRRKSPYKPAELRRIVKGVYTHAESGTGTFQLHRLAHEALFPLDASHPSLAPCEGPCADSRLHALLRGDSDRTLVQPKLCPIQPIPTLLRRAFGYSDVSEDGPVWQVAKALAAYPLDDETSRARLLASSLLFNGMEPESLLGALEVICDMPAA